MRFSGKSYIHSEPCECGSTIRWVKTNECSNCADKPYRIKYSTSRMLDIDRILDQKKDPMLKEVWE